MIVVSPLKDIVAAEPLAITVRGTCMEPRILDGQEVLLAPTRVPLPGDVVAVSTPEGVLLHRALGVVLVPGRGLRLVTQADRATSADALVPLACVVGVARVPVSGRERVAALVALGVACARAGLRRVRARP